MFGWKKKKQEREENNENQEIIEDGFRRIYNVALFYEEEPHFPKDLLLKRLRENCGNVKLLSEDKDQDFISFVFEDYLVEYKDNQKAPASCIIAKGQKLIDVQSFESSIQQSWRWEEARDVVEKCKYSILISDMMAGGLEYRQRLALFQKILVAVIQEVPCTAIHWVPSQQFVNPDTYIESQTDTSNERYLNGALNVRFFNISNGAENEMLMDTIGLAALGIPDLQCHFIDLDPQEVARLLYNCGYYLFENGDVIEDGHTVEGIQQGQKWKCQHEFSLVEPQRIVVDINPGKGYAAGDR